jgi:hypothetical protein
VDSTPEASTASSKPAWKPRRNEDRGSPNGVATSARGLLNKLTAELFTQLSNDFLDLPIKSQRHVEAVVNAVVDKAAEEAPFTPLYARLCSKVIREGARGWQGGVPEEPSSSSTVPDVAIDDARSFRWCLLDALRHRISDDLDATLRDKISEIADSSDREEADDRRRKRRLSLVRFIAELTSAGVAGPKVALSVAVGLLDGWETFGTAPPPVPAAVPAPAAAPSEPSTTLSEAATWGDVAEDEDVPVAIKTLPSVEDGNMDKVMLVVELLKFAGGVLDQASSHVMAKIFLTRVLAVLAKISSRPGTPKRVRFAVQNLAQLREKGWLDVTLAAQGADKTLDEVRETARIARLAERDPEAAARAQAAMIASKAGFGSDSGWSVAGAVASASGAATSSTATADADSDEPVVPYPGETLSREAFQAECVEIFDRWRSQGKAGLGEVLEQVRHSLLQGRPSGYKCKQAMLLFVRKCVQHALDVEGPILAMDSLVSLCASLCKERVRPGVVHDELLRPVEVADGALLVMDFWADVAVDVPLLHEYLGHLVGASIAAGVMQFKDVQDGVAQATGGFAAAVLSGHVRKMLEVILRVVASRADSADIREISSVLRPALWCERPEAAEAMVASLGAARLIEASVLPKRR